MEAFIAMITLFGGNFAVRGWAFCQGQLIAINTNQALFSLLGTQYGGDGRSTFALPDLRGRAPIGFGTGSYGNATSYSIGQTGGAETVTLNINQIPAHNHIADTSGLNVAIRASDSAGVNNTPEAGNALGVPSTAFDNVNLYNTATPNVNLAGGEVSGVVDISNNGGSQPHENRQPYMAMNYIIAMVGIFPSRN